MLQAGQDAGAAVDVLAALAPDLAAVLKTAQAKAPTEPSVCPSAAAENVR